MEPDSDELAAPEPLAALPEDDDGVRRSVLGRVDCIIGAFDRADGALTLHELTERTGLPKSTVHRMVDQLIGIGWIEREVSGYRIGMRLFEIGGLASRRSRLSDLAYPHLHSLSVATGLAVQMAILDGVDVVYLERIPMRGFRLPTRQGGRQPAYCTALGKAMLAFDEETAAEVLAQELPGRTTRTLTTPRGAADRARADRRERAGLRPPGVLRRAGLRGRARARQRSRHRRGLGDRAGVPDRPPRRRPARPQHGRRHLERALPAGVSRSGAAPVVPLSGIGPAVPGTPVRRLAAMTNDDQRFGGVVGRTVAESTPWWPEPVRPAAGQPERGARPARRHGLQRHRHRTGPRSPTPTLDRARRRRHPVHELPHHTAVLAVPGGHPDRPEPPPGRLRRGRQLRPRLPRLDDGDRPVDRDPPRGAARRRATRPSRSASGT